MFAPFISAIGQLWLQVPGSLGHGRSWPNFSTVPEWMPTWIPQTFIGFAADGKTALQTWTHFFFSFCSLHGRIGKHLLNAAIHLSILPRGELQPYLGGVRKVLDAGRELLLSSGRFWVFANHHVGFGELHSQLNKLFLRQEELGVVALHMFFEPAKITVIIRFLKQVYPVPCSI